MEMTRDRLHLLAGISALGFGIYCLIIGIGAVAFKIVELNFILMLFCFIFGIIYILYGITALRTEEGRMVSFMGVGIIVSAYWWSPGLPWFMWPMIIMPVVILVFTILILIRAFSGNEIRKRE